MPHRLVVVAYVGAVAATYVALNHASEQRSEQKLRSSVTSCEKIGNPARALDRLDVGERVRELRERFQPILNCHATYMENEGSPVPLSPEQQRAYVNFMRRGVRPAMRRDGSLLPEQ